MLYSAKEHMQQTFVNLPDTISSAISELLSSPDNNEWVSRAIVLHERYMEQQHSRQSPYVKDTLDVMAYLGLRIPATYAQIVGALLQIQEVNPSWQPRSVLDLGSGPGTGVWAAHTVWDTISSATCFDNNENFLSVGNTIARLANITIDMLWEQHTLPYDFDKLGMFDLVIIANTLNEISDADRKRVIERIYPHVQGVIVIIEPGTPHGFSIVQTAAKQLAEKGTLVAPYVEDTVVSNNEYWIHFPQRFIRPEFERRVRQHLRDSSLKASDWEDAKYAFVAGGTIAIEKEIWGRCVGQIKKEKGLVKVPVLTKEGVMLVQVLKRHKKEYAYAKELVWGQVIENQSDLFTLSSNKEE